MMALAKTDLIDGKYYEGILIQNEQVQICRWNAKKDMFENVFHHWSDCIVLELSHFNDTKDSFAKFAPFFATEPRIYEKIEYVD